MFIAGAAVAQSEPLPAQDRAVAAYYPPLMIDDGEVRPGIAVEILRRAARQIGREVTLEFEPFERALYDVRTRSDTMMPALFRNDAREDSFLWIAQLYSARLRFLTIDGQINSFEEARRLETIGVEAGSTGDKVLTELGFENLSRVGGPDANALMLSEKRIGAWFLTRPLAEAVWRRLDLTKLLIAGDVIHEIPIYLVAGQGFPEEVAAQYSAAISDMKDDGTVLAIQLKYKDPAEKTQ